MERSPAECGEVKTGGERGLAKELPTKYPGNREVEFGVHFLEPPHASWTVHLPV